MNVRHYIVFIVIMLSIPLTTRAQNTDAKKLAITLHNQLCEEAYMDAFHTSSLLRRAVTMEIITNGSCLFSEYIALCHEAVYNLDTDKEIKQFVNMYRHAYHDTPNRFVKRIEEIGTYYFRHNSYMTALLVIEELLKDTSTLTSEQQASLLTQKGWCLNYSHSPYLAYQAFSKAMDYCKKNFGEMSSPYAKATNGMAYECQYLKKDALPYYKKLLYISREVYGEDAFETAVCHDNISATYLKQQQLDSALLYSEIAYNIFAKSDCSVEDLSKCLNNMGTIYVQKGDTAKALTLYMEALNLRPSSTLLHNIAKIYSNQKQYEQAFQYLSKMSDNYKNCVYAAVLAECYAALGNYTHFVEYEKKFLDYKRESMQNNFRLMINAEREQYWTTNHDCYCDSLFRIACRTGNKESATICYDHLLLQKSLLLAFNKSFEFLASTLDNANLKQKYENYLHLKKLADIHPSFKAKKDACELEILNDLQALGIDYTTLMNVNAIDVAKKLKPNDLAIEFYVSDKHDEERIYAVVLEPNGKATVELICKTQQVADFNVWLPLKKYLDRYKHIYFSADGILHTLPLESYLSGSNLPLSETHKMYRLSSTRELVQTHASPNTRMAVIFGGLKYKMSENDNEERITDGTVRGSLEELTPLPGTEKEARNIEKIILNHKYESLRPILITGKEGTEDTLKALEKKDVRLLHIATHGFYIPTHGNDENIATLNNCGLYMSGAQETLWGMIPDSTREDGILSAHEISLLDLRGMELVVLSACETAKGDIKGDGVFGLQRGFKIAGAKSILMALWEVDDEATNVFMSTFYKQWLKGHTKQEALESAKKEIRNQDKWKDPRYWAAFILLDSIL